MNRLGAETSPYLRQHKENPVDWYAWGDEAFQQAKARDVPILLSVGYSACHWCHVMAHECFEDSEVADAMNAGFVNVKVDREERPDVDAIYMEAVQAITGNGGWPMTVFMAPDGRPFHGGTYYPKPAFLEIMARVRELWTGEREKLEDAATQLSEAVRAGTAIPSRGWAAKGDAKAHLDPDLLATAGRALLSRYDAEWGGFGRAPKFPQPPMVETLLHAAVETGDPNLGQAVVTTLDAMASGGIYDHLGGGFARYATDRQWLVPHFEKMLYDNSLLARVYLHGWQATGLRRWRQVVEETLSYLLTEPMRLPGAGFASAEDADSEGVEGKFYVWSLDELLEVGGQAAADWYGASAQGNWEHTNILWRPRRGDLERTPEIEAARRRLLERRNGRTRPGLDDKVLTEWNAMAVAALAECGAALQRTDFVAEAEEVAGFLLSDLRRTDGRWMRSWQGGQARHLAYGADHAWLVEAFTRLAEATGRKIWIDHATEAADSLLDLFWDGDAGGFRTTGRDAEQLIASPMDTQDGALPSTNSVAVVALLRLSALTGEEAYRARAEEVVTGMGPALGAAPVAFAKMIEGAHLLQRTPTEITVSGSDPVMLAVVRGRYLPDAVLTWGEPHESPMWEGRGDGRTYVCQDHVCRAPVATAVELEAQLRSIHPYHPLLAPS